MRKRRTRTVRLLIAVTALVVLGAACTTTGADRSDVATGSTQESDGGDAPDPTQAPVPTTGTTGTDGGTTDSSTVLIILLIVVAAIGLIASLASRSGAKKGAQVQIDDQMLMQREQDAAAYRAQHTDDPPDSDGTP